MSSDRAVWLRVRWWRAKRAIEQTQYEPLGFALWFLIVLGVTFCLARMARG
jgi:hypothetical protein